MRKQFFLSCFLLLLIVNVSAADSIRVACIGNSVTFGSGLIDPSKESYPVQLGKLLGGKYQVRNFGKPGATLLRKGHRPYANQIEFRDAVRYMPDVAIIELGLNDTDPRNWPYFQENFLADYLYLIQTIRNLSPKCKIYVCRMPPITFRHARFKSGTREWYEQIQQRIEQFAATQEVELIDLQAPLYNRPDLFPDAIHPTAEGAAIIASTVYSALTGNYGGLQLPLLYGDNMVFQRNRPVVLKGIANAGQKISVVLGSQKGEAVTGTDGRWMITLDSLKTGASYLLSIASPDKKISFRNVVTGEVWLCSGQSNMALRVNQSATLAETMKQPDDPNIRLFNMQPAVFTDAVSWDSVALQKINRLDYYTPTKWTECTAETVPGFSAVAYYFGKRLADSLKVPVALICNAIGGSPAEAWIDRRTLEADPEFVDMEYKWIENDRVQSWVRERAGQNTMLSNNKLQRHPYEPCFLFETGIQPLQSFPIAGVIWYQGESNEHNVELHERLFPAVINSWRTQWGYEFPFYYVQLSGLATRYSWPLFRDSQRRMLKRLSKSGMAVCSDLGNEEDVHPRDKKQVGERLAAWALQGTYGYNLLPSGPLYKGVSFREGAAFVSFDYADGLRSADGKELRTFELAGADGLFVPATATIVGEDVKVTSPSVKDPKQVRYAWQPYTHANLVNKDGLPASTFRNQ